MKRQRRKNSSPLNNSMSFKHDKMSPAGPRRGRLLMTDANKQNLKKRFLCLLSGRQWETRAGLISFALSCSRSQNSIKRHYRKDGESRQTRQHDGVENRLAKKNITL